MARVQFKMPDDFLLSVSRLESQTDEILPKVLEVGAEIVLSKVKTNLSAVVGKNTTYKSRATGELERSLGVTQPLQDRNGNWNIKVGFSEPRNDGNSNAQLANILEYGKHGQAPKPFLKPARSQSRKACMVAMKTKLQSEVEKL